MQWWVAALLLVIGTHSQLEYPLWYVFSSALPPWHWVWAAKRACVRNQPPRAMGHSPRPLLGRNDPRLAGRVHQPLRNTLYARTVNDWPSRVHAPASMRWRACIANRCSRPVPLGYAHQIEVNQEALPDKITVCEMAIRFSPVDLVTFKLAWLLALDDHWAADARSALHRAIATHPAYATTAAKELDQLVRQFPEIGWLNADLSRLMQRN